MYSFLRKYSKLFIFIGAIIVSMLSFFIFSEYFSSVDTWSDFILYLNDKKDTVMELTVTSTAASAALSALPGDVATPIANKLVDLSSYFLIVLSALYLEKYLLTIIPFISFSILIPISCFLIAIYILLKLDGLKQLAIKLFVCALTLSLVIPSSVYISKIIETTYEMNTQLNITPIEPDTNQKEEDAKEESWFDKLIDSAEEGIDNITNGITDKVGQAKTILNNLIEALAVMIVTSCFIPILVFIFFGWIIKLIFNINFNINYKIKKSSKSEKI